MNQALCNTSSMILFNTMESIGCHQSKQRLKGQSVPVDIAHSKMCTFIHLYSSIMV